MPSGYTFPFVTGPSTTVTTDFDDVFVKKYDWVDSGLWVWGAGTTMGDGTSAGKSFPTQIGSYTGAVTDVDMGVTHVLLVRRNGTLWSWGSGEYGGLGNNETTLYPSSPTQVGSDTNWKQVSAGGRSNIGTPSELSGAIKTNGTLWTWGYSTYGTLGNGTHSIGYSSPVQIGSLTNWKYIAMGGYEPYAAMALKTDGTLWAWGSNDFGRLGIPVNVTVNYSSPVQIGSLTNWKQVSISGSNVKAIKTDGTLWAWGAGNYIGNGTTAGYSSPILIGALTNWKQVNCASKITHAIKTDGTLWAWGTNDFGALGIGSSSDILGYLSPIQIGSLTNWAYVSGKRYTIFAIKTDGTLWGWGYGAGGELGNGSTSSYSSPIQIGSLTTWKNISPNAQSVVGFTLDDISYTI